MPRISRTFALDRGELTVANAYGGLVYLECDEGLSGSIDLQITGCVESPLFELGVTTATVWREHLRQRPAPWAELPPCVPGALNCTHTSCAKGRAPSPVRRR